MSKKSSNKTVLPANVEENIMEIRKFIKIIGVSTGIQQIKELVATKERQAIWVLCSGKLTRDQISSESGVSLRTVTSFIDTLKTHGLVEEETGKGGHPLRVIDYIPSEWKELVKKKKKLSEEQKPFEEPKPQEEQKPEPSTLKS